MPMVRREKTANAKVHLEYSTERWISQCYTPFIHSKFTVILTKPVDKYIVVCG